MDLALSAGHWTLLISHKLWSIIGSLQIAMEEFELDQRFPLDLAKSVTQFFDQSTFDRCLINDVLEKIKWPQKSSWDQTVCVCHLTLFEDVQ